MYDGMPQSVGDVTAHRRLLLGVWAGPWIGLQLNRKDLAGYAGRGPSLASPCADVDRLSDRRFVVMGRQEPGRLGEVLSARRHEPGGAPALLRLSVPLVEVDSSYYAMPLPVTTQQWAERTPDEFVFNDKSSKSDLLRSMPS